MPLRRWQWQQPNGQGNAAKDLRSDEVQKQRDAALSEVITKGRGKMPAFGAKIKPDRPNEAGRLHPSPAEQKITGPHDSCFGTWVPMGC
jgi:hypothetical protein